jgi:hypothetical protein
MITATAAPATAQTNTDITFTAIILSGTQPYKIAWSGAIYGTGESITTKFSTSGTKTAYLEVIDASGKRKTVSVKAVITKTPTAAVPTAPTTPTGPELMISAAATPATAQINTDITFTAIISGGTPPYKIMWSGAISGTTESITTTFTSGGYKTAKLEVIDASGKRKTVSVTTKITTPPPAAALHVTVAEEGAGNRDVIWHYYFEFGHTVRTYTVWGVGILFTAYPTGGTPPYSYSWTGDFWGSTQTVGRLETEPGTYKTTVTVTDAAGKTATASGSITIKKVVTID